VSQIAGLLQLSPKLLAQDEKHGCMVLEYIEPKEWPDYEEDPVPYHECMYLLREFHELGKGLLRTPVENCPHKPYFPYSKIQDIAKFLKKENIPAPQQFYKAARQVAALFKIMRPWIEQHGVIGHHEFHVNNCILSKDRPYIIDWTHAAPLSDPYNDVASFANIFPLETRLELLMTYLREDSLTKEQYAHFRLADIISYMRIAALCFEAQKKVALPGASERASIVQEMERLLDMKELTGRSFLSVPYAHDGEKLRLRGLLALNEFIELSREIPALLAALSAELQIGKKVPVTEVRD
jgi:thiamine kinase-like enzyme